MNDRLALRQRKENTMAIFEFSDGFDAVGWYMDHPQAMDGEWEDPEYPF
jgi:hypothetical protein